MDQLTFSTKSYLRLFGILQPEELFSGEELVWIENWITGANESDPDILYCDLDLTDHNQRFLIPFTDDFVLNRLKEKGIEQISIWNEHDFAVCLTHDVDSVESYSPRVFLRNLQKRKQFTTDRSEQKTLRYQLFKTRIKLAFPKIKDPRWKYQEWIRIEEKYNIRSTFFFFVRPETANLSVYDCDYTFSDYLKYDNKRITVKQLAYFWKTAGCEIGLHGSIQTFNSEKLFDEQKRIVENATREKVLVTRQHYLQFTFTETPDVHLANNIIADSSVGFNKFNGYRLGTAFPVYIERNGKRLLEIPLIMMDSAMFVAQGKSLEEVKKEIDRKIEQVKAVKGCLTVNFHPDYVAEKDFMTAYSYLLEQITRMNCAVMNMEEIKGIVDNICVGLPE